MPATPAGGAIPHRAWSSIRPMPPAGGAHALPSDLAQHTQHPPHPVRRRNDPRTPTITSAHQHYDPSAFHVQPAKSNPRNSKATLSRTAPVQPRTDAGTRTPYSPSTPHQKPTSPRGEGVREVLLTRGPHPAGRVPFARGALSRCHCGAPRRGAAVCHGFPPLLPLSDKDGVVAPSAPLPPPCSARLPAASLALLRTTWGHYTAYAPRRLGALRFRDGFRRGAERRMGDGRHRAHRNTAVLCRPWS